MSMTVSALRFCNTPHTPVLPAKNQPPSPRKSLLKKYLTTGKYKTLNALEQEISQYSYEEIMMNNRALLLEYYPDIEKIVEGIIHRFQLGTFSASEETKTLILETLFPLSNHRNGFLFCIHRIRELIMPYFLISTFQIPTASRDPNAVVAQRHEWEEKSASKSPQTEEQSRDTYLLAAGICAVKIFFRHYFQTWEKDLSSEDSIIELQTKNGELIKQILASTGIWQCPFSVEISPGMMLTETSVSSNGQYFLAGELRSTTNMHLPIKIDVIHGNIWTDRETPMRPILEHEGQKSVHSYESFRNRLLTTLLEMVSRVERGHSNPPHAMPMGSFTAPEQPLKGDPLTDDHIIHFSPPKVIPLENDESSIPEKPGGYHHSPIPHYRILPENWEPSAESIAAAPAKIMNAEVRAQILEEQYALSYLLFLAKERRISIPTMQQEIRNQFLTVLEDIEWEYPSQNDDIEWMGNPHLPEKIQDICREALAKALAEKVFFTFVRGNENNTSSYHYKRRQKMRQV